MSAAIGGCSGSPHSKWLFKDKNKSHFSLPLQPELFNLELAWCFRSPLVGYGRLRKTPGGGVFYLSIQLASTARHRFCCHILKLGPRLHMRICVISFVCYWNAVQNMELKNSSHHDENPMISCSKPPNYTHKPLDLRRLQGSSKNWTFQCNLNWLISCSIVAIGIVKS